MHCHTEFSSDGLITFDGMLRTVRQRGIAAVCITDHDTIDGALEFQRQARRRNEPVEFIIGEERTLRDGSHVIGLFLHERIASDTLPEVIAEIHAQGGMVLAPHPFRRKDGLLRAVETPMAEHVQGIDAFEIFNAKSSHADNQRARSLLDLGLGVFGGSDAHYESDIGQCVCQVALRGNLEDSLRSVLRGEVPFEIRGIRQHPGSGERQYAPLYYRLKPYLRLPRLLVPAAKQLYRFYRNNFLEPSPPVLEQIYSHE